MNHEEITMHAKVAKSLAEAACAASDDRGTCNLDATFWPLSKGEKAAPIIASLRRAGLSASESRWIGRGIFIQPPGAGMANKRYASNQALFSSLKAAGAPVLCYYQMD